MKLASLHAFTDEVEKIAAAKAWKMVRSRSGRRPMRVDTLLKKEKDGTLFKLSAPQGKKKPPSRDDDFSQNPTRIDNPSSSILTLEPASTILTDNGSRS
jgi:hypothetical protein